MQFWGRWKIGRAIEYGIMEIENATHIGHLPHLKEPKFSVRFFGGDGTTTAGALSIVSDLSTRFKHEIVDTEHATRRSPTLPGWRLSYSHPAFAPRSVRNTSTTVAVEIESSEVRVDLNLSWRIVEGDLRLELSYC